MAKKKANPIKEILETIHQQTLDDLMGDCFAVYAKDVIQDRAIPDARDGMKPVQRRIIFDMWNTNNTIDKPTKKCAHIVGDVMGNYHPHGDSSIYEALVHMSQPWAMRMPLIDFQGNNGSIDGDGPAAFRYTEARLSAIANEMVRGIDEDTVDMELTFDDLHYEPTVLPSRFPNLMVNGSEGIAVGVATSIPPHNLKEMIQAINYRIKHPNCDVDDLLSYVQGPDFPTGGVIYAGEEGFKELYRTGNGKVTIASRYEIVKGEDGTQQIIVTEIPYRTNKSEIVKDIDTIRHDKAIPGIEEVRDESDKEGLRIAIDIGEDAKPEVVLNYLMQKTKLMSNYTAHMIAIVDGRPKTMDLVSYCDCYISHQTDVILRSSGFKLDKAQARYEVVTGLIRAISILDQVVETIKRSDNKADAKLNIQNEYGFTERQSEAIVMMPLYKLSHTDVTVLVEEKASLEKDIAYLESLLNDQEKVRGVVVEDLEKVAKAYPSKRKTEILFQDADLTVNKRDLIASEDVYISVTRDGYAKRSSLKSWKGSKGHLGAKPGAKPGDAILYNGIANTTDVLVAFTDKGNYVYVPINEIKDNKWSDEGYHLSTLVKLSPEEKVVRAFVVREFRSDLYFVMLSEKGFVKRVNLSLIPVIRRKKPISAFRFGGGDTLVDVVLTSGNSNLFVVSEDAYAVYYNENDVLATNPGSGGLKAGSFKGKSLIGLLSFAPDEKGKVLLLTDRDHTRVFDINKMNVTQRLGQGMYLYTMFKSEPHKLVYICKAEGKELPFALETITNLGERFDVIYEDFYLTPMEKNARRGEELPPKQRIIYVSREDSDLIDKNIKSYEPPVTAKEELPEVSSLDENEGSQDKDSASFEQISLFDDIEGDE